MVRKPTLYEILGIPRTANVTEIEQGRQIQLEALERAGSSLDSSAAASRKQTIRIAASTLLDASSRLTYDAQLSVDEHSTGPQASSGAAHFAQPPSLSTARTLPSLNMAANSVARDPALAHADALALRADALSLRADAMMLRAGINAAPHHESDRASGWMRTMGSGALWRIIIFFVLMSVLAFGLSRCAINMPAQGSAAESRAAERAALQEYFQNYGVRPANLAELELLQTERRRSENLQRSQVQDVDKRVSEERKFEEESRRRGDEISERLRADEERLRERQASEKQEAERKDSQRRETERLAEERRIEKLQEQWQQTLKR